MTLPTLCVYIEDLELRKLYEERVDTHNTKMKTSKYPDAGFDLLCPEDILAKVNEVTKLNTKVKCSMIDPIQSYYMYPRSSISKTKLRLANSVGIIDSGYRGNLCGMFDNISNVNVNIEKGQRLLQICKSDLGRFIVKLVDSLDDTERGEGGFGSTGI